MQAIHPQRSTPVELRDYYARIRHYTETLCEPLEIEDFIPQPVVDVSRFEVALNGQAVRILHSINDGEYGGETLIVWDQEKQAIVFYYFTTAGFYTTGTMRAENGEVVSRETVKGEAGGVTEVEARFRVLPDGRLHVKTRH